LRRELPGILEDAENGLPALAREVLAGLLDQFRHFDARVTAYDRQIRALAGASEPARQLMQVEAIGPQTATALVASMGDPHVFNSGRSYAASIGITPRQRSSGGKERLGRITRQGDGYLRTLLVHGARAALRVIDTKTDAKSSSSHVVLVSTSRPPSLESRRHVIRNPKTTAECGYLSAY
jgi:transposase